MNDKALPAAGAVSILFCDPLGSYSGLGLDLWGESRDARLYAGENRVVAHPPCSSWCQLAYINQKRWGRKVGDDGGCFESALAAVRRWGGVLEHPAFSYAWPAFGLPRPPRSGWQATTCGGWVAQVSQGVYGHPARKMTWLYYVGVDPPSLNWGEVPPTAQVSNCANHGDSPLPRITKKAASTTPAPFRDLLLSLARRAA